MNKDKAKILLSIPMLVLLCGTVRAQEVRGIVRGTDGKPLIGASVHWAGTTVGTGTDASGAYALHRLQGYDRLVASYLGCRSDTLRIAEGAAPADFMLQPDGLALESVVVEAAQSGNYIRRDGIAKNETISFAGLCKMACCNLAESFENSASVTVGYSDAISGARQIKMLGLAGTYTQILDENRPVMRGLSAPYGLSYTPGMWLNSIQVSKGISSVTAGHEAVTGQINLEHRKPTDEERLFVNLYLDDELRPEANISTALPVSRDGRLSTVVLLHGSMDTHVREPDHNGDGFLDMPKSDQINVANRWLWSAPGGVQLRWGWKYVRENRLGGMTEYRRSLYGQMIERLFTDNPLYGSEIRNRGANAYLKLGVPFGPALYDGEKQSELRSNLALVVDYDRFDEESYFGLNDYDGVENTLSADLMYNLYLTLRSSFIAGVRARLQRFDETLLHRVPDFGSRSIVGKRMTMDRSEDEFGAYAEYTYTLGDRLSVVAGVRGDYSTFYRCGYFTPRGQVKWNVTPTTTLRASAGMGYRSTNVVTDHIGILATGRRIVMPADFGAFDRMERAVTAGGSLTQTFDLIRSEAATLSFDYFRTQFFNSVVADQERDAEHIYIYATHGRSRTDSYQLDFTWTPVDRLDLFATFRYTDSKMTLERADGSRARVERPLVSRYKTLVNIQYATKFRRWVFDVTAQLNGPARIPTQTGDLADSYHSPAYPVLFAQVSRKVGKFDLYLGCENIADYRQHRPILAADAPFSTAFNSSLVWGPLMGRKLYAGMRFNLY